MVHWPAVKHTGSGQETSFVLEESSEEIDPQGHQLGPPHLAQPEVTQMAPKATGPQGVGTALQPYLRPDGLLRESSSK